MADAKAALLRRDQYGFRWAAALAAELIAAAEQGQDPAPVSMLIEALDADEWDDIVVEYQTRSGPTRFTHWQVKRQSTDLSAKAGEKLLKAARDLSAAPGTVPREFRFGVQAPVAALVQGGPPVELRALGALCDKARATGALADAIRVADALEDRAYQYAGTVTGLGGAQLTSLLTYLHIEFLGSEDRIATTAIAYLQPFYTNAPDVYDALRLYLGDHADGRTRVTYHKIYDEVLARIGKRESTRPMWLHLRPSSSLQVWEGRGPLSASPLVPTFWESSARQDLRIDASPAASADVARALGRLIIHKSAGTRVFVSNRDAWAGDVLRRCSLTVGVDPASLHMDPFDGACCPLPPLEVATGDFAGRLKDAMDAAAWNGIVEDVRLSLANNGAPDFKIHADLAKKGAQLWESWIAQLGRDEGMRRTFLAGLLSMTVELDAPAFEPDTRVGPRSRSACVRGALFAVTVGALVVESGAATRPWRSAHRGVNLQVDLLDAHVCASEWVTLPGGEPHRVLFAMGAALPREPTVLLLPGCQQNSDELVQFARGLASPFHAGEDRLGLVSADADVLVLTADPTLHTVLGLPLEEGSVVLANRLKQFREARQGRLASTVKAALADTLGEVV